jgi:hypothetical protein
MTYVEELEARIEQLESQLERNMRGFRVPLPGDVVVLKEPFRMCHSEVLTHNRQLVKVLKKYQKHIIARFEGNLEFPWGGYSSMTDFITYDLPAGTKMILCSYDIKQRRNKSTSNYDYVRFQLLELPGVEWEYKKLYFRLKHEDIKALNAVSIDLE